MSPQRPADLPRLPEPGPGRPHHPRSYLQPGLQISVGGLLLVLLVVAIGVVVPLFLKAVI